MASASLGFRLMLSSSLRLVQQAGIPKQWSEFPGELTDPRSNTGTFLALRETSVHGQRCSPAAKQLVWTGILCLCLPIAILMAMTVSCDARIGYSEPEPQCDPWWSLNLLSKRHAAGASWRADCPGSSLQPQVPLAGINWRCKNTRGAKCWRTSSAVRFDFNIPFEFLQVQVSGRGLCEDWLELLHAQHRWFQTNPNWPRVAATCGRRGWKCQMETDNKKGQKQERWGQRSSRRRKKRRGRFYLAPDKAPTSAHADGHSQGSCHPGESTLEQGKDVRRRKPQREAAGFGLWPPGLPALLSWCSLGRTQSLGEHFPLGKGGEMLFSSLYIYIFFCSLVPILAIKYLF